MCAAAAGYKPEDRQLGGSRRVRPLVLIAIALAVAVGVDGQAPWLYVMTPLYTLPILIAAQYLPPRGVAATAAMVLSVNVGSSLIQGTPREVWVLYTAGLGLAAWLATGLARQRQQADRTVREADEARRALERLMAIVAHDLRNPLTALVGHVQLLRRQLERPSPEALQRALVAVERIRGVADGMQGLTDDLLVTGSVAAGHLRIQPRPTDLAAIARDVVELEQAATEAHHLALEAPDSLVGEWDAARLAQVLVNLVSNAIKYSSGGRVRVVLRRAADNALLTVSDQGPGIPAGEVDRLFKAYARLDRDRATEGAGLGLYIVASIVEAHGGRVWVESGWGHGSTFCVALPLRQARDGLGR